MDLNTATTMMSAGMRGLETLLGGPVQGQRVIYQAFAGWDTPLIAGACHASDAVGYDAVVGLFDPDDLEGGVRRIGICLADGSLRLQFGRLWMAPGAEHAVLVPRGLGKAGGHYVLGRERVEHRRGWPAADLARGTERAEARLAEIGIRHAMAARNR